jgi:hypothetical protein
LTEKKLKIRKDLFCLKVLKGPIHDFLAPFFWTHCERKNIMAAKVHGGEGCLCCSGQEAESKKGTRDEEQPFKGTAPRSYLL